ncbi:MAG: HTH cro/C1-type domain-containing protein [uncultured Clostridium sp.]
MNERLRILRKELKLSQSEFGSKIGVSHAAISSLERGENNISERMAISISNIFDVNIEWLLYGTGSMFLSKETFFIDELSEEFNLDEMDRNFLLSYLNLSESDRKGIKNLLKSLLEQQKKGKTE